MSRSARPPGATGLTLLDARWKWFALLFAVWTLLALLSVAQTAMAFSQRGQPIAWGQLFASRFLDWYSCAVFTPAFFWLVRRYPLDETPKRITVPLYLVVSGACAVLKFALQLPIVRLIGGPRTMTLRAVLAQGFLVELMIFWAIIAAIQALELQRKLSRRERVALRLRAQLSEAELELLKGQLRPHFLFNTLNGVASLIHTAPDVADFVVVQLSDLLRASLDHEGAREVPLADELALLDKYLAIMDARFGGRLSIDRAVSAAARSALVPQFLLQPLIENALEHGIGRRAGAGRITIRASVDGADRLRLEVSDDGAGIAGGSVTDEGVGLRNTRQRLERLYGHRQSLALSPIPGGGTLVVVEMPLCRA
ncbi:MAG TPA: histidine kinase [Gemmatimonadaceae bacterium]|nr:histidine kinase [Gemmatimonadaceae bacterium]